MEKPLQSSPEELDSTAQSTKKSKRKITHLIFNQNADQEMAEATNHLSQISLLRTETGRPGHMPTNGPSFRDMVAADHMQRAFDNSLIQEDEDDVSDDDMPPDDTIDDPQCPLILLTKEEKKRLRHPWKYALIIKMFESKIGYMSLMKRLKKKWELSGGLVLTDVGHEYFIARFSNVGDYNHVLTQGPWMFDDNYLTIRKWIPNFVPDNAPMRFLTAWVRIPHLSVE